MVVESQLTIKSKSFLKKLDKIKSNYPVAAKNIALEFANESQKLSVQGIIPVVTGNLRSTSRVEEAHNSVKFITGGKQGSGKPSKFVNYAKFVNSGTSRQSPQFFMERSVNAAARKFNSFSKKVLKSWLKHSKA
jgi:HK97 gp10 family phage protein